MKSLNQTLTLPQQDQDNFKISFAPLSLEEIYQLADDGANGAIVLMSGTVRNQTDGKAVSFLEYQGYEPMAKVIFQQIATEIRKKWSDVNRVVIHHRIGKLNIGEISVLVAVGCPHRGEALKLVVMPLIPLNIMHRFGRKNIGKMALVNG